MCSEADRRNVSLICRSILDISVVLPDDAYGSVARDGLGRRGNSSHESCKKMSQKTYRPGEKAPVSGQYGIKGTGTERTVVKGEPLPPTPKSNQKYVVNDPSKNGAGRGGR